MKESLCVSNQNVYQTEKLSERPKILSKYCEPNLNACVRKLIVLIHKSRCKREFLQIMSTQRVL